MSTKYAFLALTFTYILLMTFSLPAAAQDTSLHPPLSNNTSRNENIVFADLHIIQAIRELLGHNSTGALDQLALAKERLDRAQ